MSGKADTEEAVRALAEGLQRTIEFIHGQHPGLTVNEAREELRKYVEEMSRRVALLLETEDRDG